MMDPSPGADQAAQSAPAAVVACDCHHHVYATAADSPSGVAPHMDAGAEDFRRVRDSHGIARSVVVQPSAFGSDNRLLVDALNRLGDSARGVAVVTPDVSDTALTALHVAGVRAIRFNHVFSPGHCEPGAIASLADRVAHLGWHLEICATPAQLLGRAGLLQRVPVPVVIDHMALLPAASWQQDAALALLEDWLASGRCWVKLSGPYLTDPAWPSAQTLELPQWLLVRRPDRMVWGSDWPHPSKAMDEKPAYAALLGWLHTCCGTAQQVEQVMVTNPARLYGWTRGSWHDSGAT